MPAVAPVTSAVLMPGSLGPLPKTRPVRIATWNVNSIRSRIDRVEAFLQRQDVDVLALQETKCKDDQFPEDRLTALGYEVAHHGLSQWNGVALDLPGRPRGRAGRVRGDAALRRPARLGGAGPRRHLRRGADLVALRPQRARARRPAHGLQAGVAGALRATATTWVAEDPSRPVALVGDWNVAPQDEDVWDMAFFEGKTHVSAPERAAFQAVLDAGYTDVVRPHTPGRAPTRIGTTPSCASRSGRACGSTSCSAHGPRRPGGGRVHRP